MYFEFKTAMMLNDRGLQRLADIMYLAKAKGMKKSDIETKIKRVFRLTTEEFKRFGKVNNCKS